MRLMPQRVCEAVTRPSMRFVPVKTIDQQAALMLHRCRDLLIRQRTQLINALRAHLAELGMIAAKGKEGVKDLVAIITDAVKATATARADEASLASACEATRCFAAADRRTRAQHSRSASRE